MPSIGEQGWGDLVSNNFEILDTNLNDLQNQITTNLNNLNNLQDQIDVIDTNIGNGTRILHIPIPNSAMPTTITSENFENYASYDDNNVYTALFGNTVIFESIPQPTHSCRLMIISVNGDLTINGNINTYPTTLQNELPPGTPETNIYENNIDLADYHSYKITLVYTANGNNSKFSMNYEDYLNFINNTIPHIPISTTQYLLSIPHAIAAGGNTNYTNGTSGTAENTSNGGGGGYAYGITGGTGCIFGQYAGSDNDNDNGCGYGSGATNKYRCGLVFIVNGNLTINESGTITQNGGDGNFYNGDGGYGGGAYAAGGGGAPVFIYYTGTYTNNGTINTAGGSAYNYGGSDGGVGGAGGIKVTKITI